MILSNKITILTILVNAMLISAVPPSFSVESREIEESTLVRREKTTHEICEEGCKRMGYTQGGGGWSNCVDACMTKAKAGGRVGDQYKTLADKGRQAWNDPSRTGTGGIQRGGRPGGSK